MWKVACGGKALTYPTAQMTGTLKTCKCLWCLTPTMIQVKGQQAPATGCGAGFQMTGIRRV